MKLYIRSVILLLFAVLISADGMSLEFGQVQITDAKGSQINRISQGNPVLVNIAFTYSVIGRESLDNIYVDASNLYPNGIYAGIDYSAIKPECAENYGGLSYNCSVKGLTLKTGNSTINITIGGKYTGEEGTENIKNTTQISLVVDNTKPKIAFMGTNACYGESCYISSNSRNTINIVMEDESATFNKANVAFRIGGKNHLVNNCSGMSCSGSAKVECSDKQIVQLGLRHDGIRSRDDVGNKVEGLPIELICDSSAPEVKATEITSSVGSETLIIGKDAIISFNVTDITSPTMTMFVDAQSIAAGNLTFNCSKVSMDGAMFICRAVMRPLVEIPGKYKVNAVFKDIVGKETSTSVEVTMLKTTNETINLWTISEVQQSGYSFSRPNLEFDRTIFARVNLQSSGDAAIIDIKPQGNCYATDNFTGKDSDIVSIRMIAKQEKSIYLKLALRSNHDGRYDKLQYIEYNCPVTISSKKGNYYFSSPENDTFTIRINLTDDANMQQLHKSEVDRVKKEIETNEKIIQSYDKTIGYLEMYCRTCNQLLTTTAASAYTEGGLASTGFGRPIAQTLVGVNNALEAVNYAGACTKADEICKIMTCETRFQNSVTDWMDSKSSGVNGQDTWTNLLGYEDISTTLNPYKSYVVAAATACVPALIYHYKVYNGIQCNYLDCISNDYVQYGQDISTCKQDKAFSECMFWSGGAMDAIPFVSMFRDVSKQVGNMVKDPVAMFGFAAPLACKIFSPEASTHGFCIAVQDTMAAVNTLSTISSMAGQFANYQHNDPDAQCGTVLQKSNLNIDRETQAGYPAGYTSFSASKPFADGMLSCNDEYCSWKGRNGETVNMKPIKQKDGTYDIIYYSGNKKVNTKNIVAYGRNSEEMSVVQNELEINTQIRKDAAEAQIKSRMISRGMSEAEIDYRLRDFDDEYNRELLVNLVGHMKIEKEVIEMQQRRQDEMVQKYGRGIIEYMDTVDKKTREYQDVVKTEQTNILRKDKEISATKKIDKYLKSMESIDDSGKITYDYSKLNANQKEQLNKAVMELSIDIDYDLEKDASKPAGIFSNKITDGKALVDKLNSEDSTTPIGNNIRNQLNVDELKKKKEGSEDKIKTAAKSVRAAMLDEKWEKEFGTWNRAAMTAWGNVRGISNMRSVTNTNWLMFNEKTKISQFGDTLIEDVSQFEKAWCKKAITPEERLGDAVVMNAVSEDTYRTGAQVGGRKSQLVNDGKKSYYEYWIQGNVVTGKNNAAAIRVILYDASGQEYDFTSKLPVMTNSLSKGTQAAFGRPSPEYFTDAINYEKICLKFDAPLNVYFDHVSGNGDSICQKIISE